MSNFSDEVVKGLVDKLQTLKLTGQEQELLNHLLDAATALSDEQLDGAAGGAPGGYQPGGPVPRGRSEAPGVPSAPGSGPASKLRRN